MLQVHQPLYYYSHDGYHINGPNPSLKGDYTDLYGNCTELYGDGSFLSGDCSNLRGDCTGIKGDCTGHYGCLFLCEITEEERARGSVTIELIKQDESITPA